MNAPASWEPYDLEAAPAQGSGLTSPRPRQRCAHMIGQHHDSRVPGGHRRIAVATGSPGATCCPSARKSDMSATTPGPLAKASVRQGALAERASGTDVRTAGMGVA
jgi:hypothetical protein